MSSKSCLCQDPDSEDEGESDEEVLGVDSKGSGLPLRGFGKTRAKSPDHDLQGDLRSMRFREHKFGLASIESKLPSQTEPD